MDDQKLAELFASIRNGDTEAFAMLYESYKKPVYTVLWRIVNSKEIAEDLTHELFVKLFTDPPAPTVKKPRAYVFTMARNLALNALGSQRYSSGEYFDDLSLENETEIDLRLDLNTAIGRLSDSQRQVLTLHLNAELTFLEISGIMGLSLPATYRMYKKALKSLQNYLDGGCQ